MAYEDEYNLAAEAFLAHFRRFVAEQFGERCEDYEPGCACCDMWKLYDETARAVAP